MKKKTAVKKAIAKKKEPVSQKLPVEAGKPKKKLKVKIIPEIEYGEDLSAQSKESKRESYKLLKSEINKNKEKVLDYSPAEIYSIGDYIYHKIWRDTGKIIEVKSGFGNRLKMMVVFHKLGVKKLAAMVRD